MGRGWWNSARLASRAIILLVNNGAEPEPLSPAAGTDRLADLRRAGMQMRWLVAVSMAIVCGHAVSAQVSPRRTNIPIPFRTYVAFNPLLVPFDIGSVEMETGVAQGVTLGGVGSYTNVDKQRYSSFDLDVRYYPGEVVLRGFSIGLSGGFLRYTNHVGTPETRTSIDVRVSDRGRSGRLQLDAWREPTVPGWNRFRGKAGSC